MTKRPNNIKPIYIPGIKTISETGFEEGKLINPFNTGYTIIIGKISPLKTIHEPTPINPKILTNKDFEY
jgi:hypothetical protein